MSSKLFLISFLISLPFWFGANVLEQNLEQVFFIQEIKNNPQILSAQINQQIFEQKLRDIRAEKKQIIESLEIEAESAISVKINKNNNQQKILLEKNSCVKLPIASLTKLMTAHTVLENYDLDQVIEISEQALEREEDFGGLLLGEKITAQDLLYLALIESSNDAAFALAEQIGEIEFAGLMNLEAQKTLGLENTYFVNSTGLDPDDENQGCNYSTAQDLAEFSAQIIDNPLIFDILSQSEVKFSSADGTYHHLKTTNEFLEMRDNPKVESEYPEWLPNVIAGKTGWTSLAGGCLILVLELADDEYLINVILGSDDKFVEMQKMIDVIWKTL
jgi:D-alanyl-D-alanine carboxypeptidase